MKAILLILLLVSATGNIYQYYECKETEAPPAGAEATVIAAPTGCIVTNGFAEPFDIDLDHAKLCTDQYKESLKSPDSTLGGVISRAAFDSLFCMDKCNGIAYSFARDNSGTAGPGASGVFIIFKGVNVEYNDASREITAVHNLPDAVLYRPGNWCPLNCMAW